MRNYNFLPFMPTYSPTYLIKTNVKINRWYKERELVHYKCQLIKWVGGWVDIKVKKKHNFSKQIEGGSKEKKS